ncbi:MAG: NAD-dependent deacylase [Flavobacteriales bacterium]|jgi:NAD-dependent deacetylase|nr:NAD-dependent deacylase [Flavobacteriales bacterium]MBK6753302.1 NAD-dependent deacylase [Flavobacteriales bacterium]MBK7269675.1 NAD-dependent deacylase [Flavobacteriales bacterium]MBK7754442.1 NAD-dependent deacylase [Flavobacteriales bacterium]MBK9076820.1 NAD-dependent deacylase [Flavobacteriales bacterium]
MDRERIVVLSGAGVSAESGLRTFRDSAGLWEEYRIEDVATPNAWRRDPGLVLRFYDLRRAQVLNAQPNAAHRAIARLEQTFDVEVITQNIDDLHERAGSTRVMHLHGEVLKARSTRDPLLITPLNGPHLRLGDRCALGSQLRPHIVWFGEEVPLIAEAAALVAQAHRLIIVGTSLQVYPAAGLVHYRPEGCPVHAIDPAELPLRMPGLQHRKEKASVGMPALALELLSNVR